MLEMLSITAFSPSDLNCIGKILLVVEFIFIGSKVFRATNFKLSTTFMSNRSALYESTEILEGSLQISYITMV